MVASFSVFLSLLIGSLMLLSVLDHAVNFVLWQARAAGHRHALLLASALVLSRNVHNAVSVNVEGDFDLRDATRCWSDASKLEGSQRLVVTSKLTLALVHLDEHGWLVVLSSGEHLRVLRRNSSVAVDELGHDATLGFNTQGEWSDVDEQHVLTVALDDARLNSSTDSHDLIWVDRLVSVLTASQLLDEVLNSWHTSRTADQNNVVNLVDGEVGVSQHLVEWHAATLEQVRSHLLEVCTSQGLVEVDWARGAHCQVLQGDLGFRGSGKLLLCLLSSFLHALQSNAVVAQVDAILVLDFGDDPVDDALIPIVTAQVGVAVGCFHLNGGEAVIILANLQQGHIESAAAQVEDEDVLILLALLQAVSQSCSGWLVDNAQNVEACNAASVLGCLALCVVEVCWAGDHCVGHFFAQEGFSVTLELHQDLCGDLLWSPLLAIDFCGPVSAHVALDGGDRTINIGHGLALGHVADENFAVLAEGDHRWRGALAFSVHDDGWLAALEGSDARIRGTQINSNCASHTGLLPLTDS